MSKVDVTYGGELNASINVIENKKMLINYTIDGESGKPTTTSILVREGNEDFLMITFDYQELKEIVENEKRNK